MMRMRYFASGLIVGVAAVMLVLFVLRHPKEESSPTRPVRIFMQPGARVVFGEKTFTALTDGGLEAR